MAPAECISHLLALPPELQEQIVEFVDPLALPTLRLSCKEMCRASTKRFARTHLANLRFCFAEESLKCLSELTAHEIFAPFIESLSFGTCRVAGDKETSDTKTNTDLILQAFNNLRECNRHQGEVVIRVFDDVIQRGQERVFRTSSCSKSFYEAIKDGAWILKGEETLSVLELAMSSTKSAPEFVSKSMVLDGGGTFNTAWDTHDRPENVELTRRRFESIIHQRGLPLKDFCIMEQELEVSFEKIEGRVTFSRSRFARPEGLAMDDMAWARFPWCVFDEYRLGDIISEQHLTDLRFTSCAFWPDNLTHLLQSQLQTLKHLEFERVVLRLMPRKDNEQQLNEFLRQLSAFSALEYLSLRYVGWTDFGEEQKSMLCPGSEAWNGREQIQSAIGSLQVDLWRRFHDDNYEHHDRNNNKYHESWEWGEDEELAAYRAHTEIKMTDPFRMWF